MLLIFNCVLLNAQDIYVNRIWHFDSNEFYIYLNFKEGYDWNNLSELNEQLGDYTFEGDENSRRTLPLQVAEKYFDLSRLHNLELYNNQHYQAIGNLNFKGVDYFDDMISSSYIAVFQIEDFEGKKPNSKTDYFCMSSDASKKTSSDFQVTKLANSDFEEQLKSKYNFTDRQLMKLVSLQIGSNIMSVLTFYGPNYENNSYLLESNNGEHKSLKVIQGDYVMWDMILTPLNVHKKPVIIMEMGVPETDNNWTQIAVFNGTEYELLTKSFVINLQ